jgi:NTP pyrophosphatase (non-canonical NTP hydrolase)
MEPWVSALTPHQARRVGKTIEELGELLAVLGRLTIHNLDDIDPGTGKTNRQRMHEETADVLAQLLCNDPAFAMDTAFMDERMTEKVNLMRQWEAHFFIPTR